MAKKITEDGEVLTISEITIEPTVPPFFKTPWNHNTDLASIASALDCSHSPSMTQQSHAKDADINEILRKFAITGELPLRGDPQYMDIDKEFDLGEQIVTRHQVEEAWNALPEITRDMLGDPARFVAFVEDKLAKGDMAALRAAGLAKPTEPPQAPPGAPKAASGGTPAPETPKPDAAPAAPGNVTAPAVTQHT